MFVKKCLTILLVKYLVATEPSGIEYVCFQCDGSFDLASELIKHFNEVHESKLANLAS